MGKKKKRAPVNLPEEERIRMTAEEMAGMSMWIACYVYVKHAAEKLRRQLKAVPYGEALARMIVGNLDSVKEDLLGTVPQKQLQRLLNMGMDMEIRMVPKLTPLNKSMVLSEKQVKELANAALEKCKFCGESNEKSLKCDLRKLLEAVLPLDDYSTLNCPYFKTEWKDK